MDNFTQSKTYSAFLSQRQGKGFSEDEVREILKQILSQLAQIHSQGFVHGAISLDTLVQNETNRQVILVSKTNLTIPVYIAPEQLQTGQITTAGDIYAVGKSAIALLTGKTIDNYGNTGSWQDDCIVSDQLATILEKAIAKEPYNRYTDAQQMLQAITPSSTSFIYPTYNKPATESVTQIQQKTQFLLSELPLWQWIFISTGVTALLLLAGFGLIKIFASKSPETVSNPVILTQPPVDNNNNSSTSIAPDNNSSTSATPDNNFSASIVNPFENVRFPQSNCGDSFPADPNDYPVSFYPVFVEYSQSNLNVIKSEFCNDAYRTKRKDTGIIAIQVASFTNFETAKMFAAFMNNRVGYSEVGAPRIVDSKANL